MPRHDVGFLLVHLGVVLSSSVRGRSSSFYWSVDTQQGVHLPSKRGEWGNSFALLGEERFLEYYSRVFSILSILSITKCDNVTLQK